MMLYSVFHPRNHQNFHFFASALKYIEWEKPVFWINFFPCQVSNSAQNSFKVCWRSHDDLLKMNQKTLNDCASSDISGNIIVWDVLSAHVRASFRHLNSPVSGFDFCITNIWSVFRYEMVLLARFRAWPSSITPFLQFCNTLGCGQEREAVGTQIQQYIIVQVRHRSVWPFQYSLWVLSLFNWKSRLIILLLGRSIISEPLA